MKKKLLGLQIRNVVLILAMLLAFILSILQSYYLASFIDSIASHTITSDDIVPRLSFLLGIILLTVIANVLLIQYLSLKLSLNKSIDYTKDVARGMLGLSQKNYSLKDNGYYINLITSSAFTCGDLYSQLNVQLIGYALCIIIFVVFAFVINVSIGIFLVYIPVYALVLKMPNKRISN